MKIGFSLVELIATIIILGLIVIIAFPNILNIVRTNKNELSNQTKELIYNATKLYINDNIDDFPTVAGNDYCVKIKTLVDNDLLTSSISEQLENYTTESYVKVIVDTSYKYTYEITEQCE